MRFAGTTACLSLALAAAGCKAASEDEVAQLRAELTEVRAEQRRLGEELRALGGTGAGGALGGAAAATGAALAPRIEDGPGAAATRSPVTNAPATSEPATSEPATSSPAASSPAASSPATSSPATSSPATSSPATSAPAAESAASPPPGSSTGSGAASTIQVPIESEPAGADVFVGETRTAAGLTPFVLAVPADGEVHLRFEKAGYRPHIVNLRPTAGVKLSVELARKGR